MHLSGRASVAIRVNGALVPVSADLPSSAIFPIYSITKTLTAICVLRLVESGVLHLEDPIRRLLPEIDVPPSITLTHLLRHTSGLRDYGGQRDYHDAVRAHPSRPWSRDQFLAAVIPKGLLFAPGDGWSYSNVGYMMVVDALERVTNRAFANILDEIVTRPLGLHSTFVLNDLHDMQRCVPGVGSDVTSDRSSRDVRDVYHPGWCAPRVVASTTEETTRVFDALIAGELLKADTLEQMFTLVSLGSGGPATVSAGMGVYSDSASRHGRNYHHGGGGPGYSTSVTIYPDMPQGRTAIAVFLDSSEGPEARECESQWIQRIENWR
jgi:D-alanyl-D-alanine carboxypeptidase